MSVLNSLQPLNLDWPMAPSSETEPSGISLLIQAENAWFTRVGIVPPAEQSQDDPEADKVDDKEK